MPHLQRSLGLVGRVLAILLLTVVIEFGASTLLYEQASRFSVREDEARRLAEHLVIARKLVSERPWRERAAMADELTTDRYDVRWTPSLPPPPPVAPELDIMRRQILTWEPTLAASDLRLRLTSPGRRSTMTGGLRLADGSWLYFQTHELEPGWDLAINRIVLALVPAIGLLILGGLLIRHMLSPLARLSRAVGQFDLNGTVTVAEDGTGEVRGVIRAFNEMQHRIHGLIDDRTQALAAVGHDIRTPLARIQLRLDGVEDREVRDAIGGDVGEMEAMVESLLAFLGGEDDPETPVLADLAVLAETVVDDAADRGLRADYAGPDHLRLTFRTGAMKRAIGNLVDNAVHYGDVAHVHLLPGPPVAIEVADEGPGIPEEELETVLRPFARRDEARGRNTKGLGLGLAIVADAVAREQGRLALRNRPEGGLVARIELPGNLSSQSVARAERKGA